MINKHIILGVETSCDETSAAILSGNKVAANIVSSQEIHAQFGGVVPELASRAHIRMITGIVEKAVSLAKIDKKDLTGIAVTHGPGLVGALLVGLNFCKGMSQALNIPYVGVNHIEGHIYGNFLSNPKITFPHLCLVVSGGHTQLVLMNNHLEYQIIGKTRDDAVGEAFDKGAKILGLGYPGGPMIDKLAQEGDDSFHNFPRAYLKGENLDFSYSGLKTSLLVYIKNKDEQFLDQNLKNICASYQKAAIEVLINKTIFAAKKYSIASIGIVGGVAANSLLRTWLIQESAQNGWKCFVPDFQYCTDNAAMIARAGLERLSRNIASEPDLNAYPSLKLEEKF
jgi:N6-L-threonylcarbamoyladenine synthase